MKQFFFLLRKQLLFRPQAYTGSLKKDLLSLCLILGFQIFCLTRLLPEILFGIILPWMVILFVMNQKKHAIFFGLIAAFVLETYQTTPAGFYFFSFASIASILFVTRNHISWRRFFPWFIVFALASIWLSLHELMLLAIKTKNSDWMSQKLLLEIAANVFFSIIFGLWVVQKQVMTYFEDPKIE